MAAGALGASLLIGPVVGSLGLAAVGVSFALIPALAFGGVMLAMGLAFGGTMLSIFGTIFGLFVLPTLVPIVFAGAGLWVWSTMSKGSGAAGTGSGGGVEAARRSEPVIDVDSQAARRSAEEEEAARDLQAELDAFDVLLKEKRNDTRL